MTDWMRLKQHNMTPIRNNILFRPFRVEEKTESGIFVPDSFRGLSDKGEVVAAGVKSKIKAGTVAYRVHDWGEEVIIDGIVHFLMQDKAILSIE